MRFERQQLNPEGEQYEKVRVAAEGVLRSIDPEMRVSLEEREIVPDDKTKKPYVGWVLMFRHKLDQSIKWSMDIDSSDDYLKNKLESVIRQSYLEKTRRN